MRAEVEVSRAEEPPPFTLHAWVDESMSVADDNGPGAYVLAAVLADPLQCEGIRDRFRALRRGREPRLHWRSEESRRRARIAAAFADVDLAAIVAVGSPARQSKQERARRCCLEHLLFELHRRQVSHVWLEARTESLNRTDVRFVEALRAQRVITNALRVDFGQPSAEPMLWLPDAVAGAVTASRRGEPKWLEMLGPTVAVVDVRVR
jgi:hypothetical protein